MIKAVLVDDERHSLETLAYKLERYCPEVVVEARFTDPQEALDYLLQDPPDLVFLDIEMPSLNGFELLARMPEVPFDVVFTTAYDEFGIRAVKVSALDYLLKPIQAEELKGAVQKYAEKHTHFLSAHQLEVLFSNIQHEKTGTPGRIGLATKESIEYVSPDEIIVCSSDSNYTMVYLKDNRKKLISRTLKDFEALLSGPTFFRVHHSHLVNLDHVREYKRADGGYLILSNKMAIPVSRSKREELLQRL